MILVSVAVYAISFVLLRALSRYREFAADRGSAILTGRPSALASALIKVSGAIERIPRNDLRTAEGMSAFFIVPARAKNSLMNLFADHPPLEQRLAALSRLEAQLQGTRPVGALRARWACATSSSGRTLGQAAGGARAPVRAVDRLRDARGLLRHHLGRRRRDRRAGARDQRLPGRCSRTPRRSSARPPASSTATVESRDDDYGFRWVIVRAPGVEDLVVAINGVSSSIEDGGYGERILCAVFAFKDASGSPINFIYNYKRGSWYPFVPAPGDKQRNTERELQLKAQIGGELPIEPELERWFPLWGVPF